MIRGSDGLDYENLTEKLLSNPAKTHRNGWVKRLNAQGRAKDERQLWIDTYDAEFARLAALCEPGAFANGPRYVTAEWDACCEADRALRFLHRERNRRVAKPLFAAQDRCCPG